MAKINTTEFYKKCVCGTEFVGTGPAAKLCPTCKAARTEEIKKQNREKIARVRAESGKIKKPGVGKGGNPYRGADHPSHKHGMYVFERLRNEIRRERKCCERCGKNVETVGQYLWVVHHKDHNHWNHVIENLELLCKRCHLIEHECWNNFAGS